MTYQEAMRERCEVARKIRGLLDDYQEKSGRAVCSIHASVRYDRRRRETDSQLGRKPLPIMCVNIIDAVPDHIPNWPTGDDGE